MPVPKNKVKQENDFSYSNKFTKKKISFRPSEEEVVATFKPQVAGPVRDIMASAVVGAGPTVDLERGFAVFRVIGNQTVRASGDALAQQPDVANAIPVMVDDEGLPRYFLPDELTVQFREGVSPKKAEQIIAAQGSAIVQQQRTPGYYTITVPEGKGLFETLRSFSALKEVAFAEPAEFGIEDALPYIPDDPEFGKLWGPHNTGQTVNGSVGLADSDIDAVEAWDITRGHPDVIVTVIDTGADMNHPDLTANYLPRGSEDWDFADGGDSSPDDNNGHGTHVAGTAAAVDNATGVIGVAPKCRIMPLRVNLTAGMNANRADAINYVAAQATAHPNRRYVVNCSWKMNGDHAGVHNAIINTVSKNVVVVFAAGNSNRDVDVTPEYPGVYPEVISVAATDQRDRRASFSNYGAKVDVSAPGVNIYSTYPDDTYAFSDGTSMAAPHVAGLAALIWSRNRTLTNQQVRTIIENNCDNIDAKNPGFVGKLGKGRINAFRALSATPPPPVLFAPLRKFRFPQLNAGSSTALAYSARFRIGTTIRPTLLFLTQQPGTERIFYLNPLNGAVMGSIDPVANDTIGSMAWDGSLIRVANVTTGAGLINAINPFTGAQVGSIPVPPGRGEAMAFDGSRLYYSTVTRIFVLNPATGAVIRSFPAPGGSCRGLAYGHGFLFSANSSTGVITILNVVTLEVRGTIAAPGTGSARAEDLAFDASRDELYIANQSENIIYVGRVTL
jgi:subtilisin family serine protease